MNTRKNDFRTILLVKAYHLTIKIADILIRNMVKSFHYFVVCAQQLHVVADEARGFRAALGIGSGEK